MVQTSLESTTLEQFLKLSDTEPASEFINGQIIQKPMPQGAHSRIQQKLITAINAVTEDARVALALPELRCTFGRRSIVPDIAVFIWERIPTRSDGTIASAFESHPDWIIAILSPDQSSTKVTTQILYSLKHQSQMGWLIDPEEQLVLVYAPNQLPDFLQEPNDLLPVPEFAAALHLNVEQLFGWLQIR